MLPVGTRVWFHNQRMPYTVQASNERFAVCTRPFAPRHTVLYTIIDFEHQIRGTENLVFGFGAETRKQCEEMLARLTSGESAVSHRNWVPLEIDRSGPPTSDREYLEQHGWRLVATRPTEVGRVHFWSHADHQPDRHGFFTQTQAVAHQRQLDKGRGCNCIREEALHG